MLPSRQNKPNSVLPVPPQGQANPPDVITMHQAWVKAQKEIVGLMLMIMDLEIQKTLEHLGAYDMLKVGTKPLYVQQEIRSFLEPCENSTHANKKKGRKDTEIPEEKKSHKAAAKGVHWRRNCSLSLRLIEKEEVNYGASTSGYPKETMGYSFYYPHENKVFVAQNAEFFENEVIDHEASGSLEDLEIIQEEDTHPSLGH
ncbi:hypothetical protein Tco_0461662 [Tanacetum coccineum]